MPRLRVGVLISGRGSNLQALIDAAAAPNYPAEITIVISNRGDAAGLARAAAAGIPGQIIADPDRAVFAASADRRLREAGVELVALAGFMRILDTTFVEAWADRMINIHPSLLPAFPGLHPQRQALAAGVKFSGCTVHFVRAAVDSGPIIAQAAVPVEDGDDEDRLAARVLAAEHRLYPLAVRLFAEGRLRIDGNRVVVLGGAAPGTVALNPTENLASGRGYAIQAGVRVTLWGWTMLTTMDAETARHQQIWLGFCRFMRIMTTFVVLLLVGMAIFLL